MAILKELSRELSMRPSELLSFVSSAPHRYKKYVITKRDGEGKRRIAQPAKQVKFLQRLVYERYFNDLPVHSAALAYRKGVGIRRNAFLHKDNSYLLKLDFTDFFPSISPDDFERHIKKYLPGNLDEEDIFVARRLFFFCRIRGMRHELSIGSPTSPQISNTLLYDLDSKIHDVCELKGITYTRYADDLTFSTNQRGLLIDFYSSASEIIQNLNYPKLEINPKKTVFASKKTNRHVTGLVLTNDSRVSIGRGKKRAVKSLIHKYMSGQLEVEKIAYLRGYLSYVSDVEPTFIHSLKNKYGSSILEEIRSSSEK